MNITDTKINNGFWKERKELNKSVSLYAVLKSFEDTGRIRALTGDNDPVKERPHIFWESDLAKLMEGAFFSMQQEKDEKLEQICDSIIDKIIANQEEDGYLNYFFSKHEPDNKFTNLRDRHELYCAGHLLESAVEHHKATGDSKFFDAMERYVDHIISKFGKEEGKMRGYPGHQEIELALVKAYEHTNKKKFLDLATVVSPKSVAFPVVAIMIKSILFTTLGVNPPKINPLVEFEQPPIIAREPVKLPKSVEFPVVLIVTNSIRSVRLL